MKRFNLFNTTFKPINLLLNIKSKDFSHFYSSRCNYTSSSTHASNGLKSLIKNYGKYYYPNLSNKELLSEKLNLRFPHIQQRNFDSLIDLINNCNTIQDDISLIKFMLKEQAEKGGQSDDILLTTLEMQYNQQLDELSQHLIQNKDMFLTFKEKKYFGLQVDPNFLVMEIRPGVGGDEACLFVSDLLNMYKLACENFKWNFSVLNFISSEEKGGCKEAIIEISGDQVFSKLKFESGVHRVQRVPITDRQGRIHTSTATVVILPKADKLSDDQLKSGDYKVETMRSSGPGGQSVNKSETAVRVIHIPTKMSVVVRKTSSQIQNKQLAIEILRSRLLEKEMIKYQQAEIINRITQRGTGDRSEKIRTYNLPQKRVVDHRCKANSIDAENLLKTGEGLNNIIEELYNIDQEHILEHILESLNEIIGSQM